MHHRVCGKHPLLPPGERAELWPGAALSREQSFERSWIGARHLGYLHLVSGRCHQRDRATAGSGRRSTQARAAAVAFPSAAGSLIRTTRAPSCSRPRRDGQTRAEPDSDTHPASVPAGDWFRQGQQTCPVIRTRVTAVQSPTMTG